MSARAFLPAELRFRGALEGLDRGAVEAAIRRGIARGLAAAGLDAGEVDSGSGPGGESAGTSLRELFDPSSHLAERGSYRVPSYDNDGEPTELPLLASREDQLFTQESRLEGRLVAIFPGWRSISVSSSRYALEPNLARALTWGQLLFGARSFVVLQGSAGYFALATDETVHSADVRLRPAGEIGGRAAYGSSGNFAWPDDIRDDQGELYTLRTLVTVEGDRLFPPRPEQFAAFFRELDATPAAERAVSATAARSFVFGEIDRLLAAEDPRGAADRLVELDANAFALVPWEVKELYLEALLAVWTGSKEEVAVVELLKSLTSRSELAAMLEKLKEAHRFGDLVDDLDDQLWSLLVVMGERFGKAEPWSFGRSVALLQDAGLLPKDLAEAIARVSQGPAGFSVGLDSLAEIEEAAYGFARFVDSSVESLWMLVSHPEKLIEGVGQLVRLLVAYHLALAGHKPSIQLIHGLLSQIGKQILAALAGIEVLGVGERVARRVRWALIWEIASWVVGVGEIKAAIAAAGVGEKALALVRLLRLVVAALEIGGESSALERNLVRLAEAMSRAAPHLGDSEKLLTLMSHLPAEDVGRLGRALSGVELAEGVDLLRLAAEHPRLGEAARDVLSRAEALATLAKKAGGLSDQVALAFERLSGHGLSAGELARVAAAIPEGEGLRFLQVVERLGPALSGSGRARAAELLERVAGKASRMEAVLEEGPGAVAAMFQRSGGQAAVFDGYLESLRSIRDGLPLERRASEYRQLLDRLAMGESEAWIRLENSRRLRAGETTLDGLAQAIAGNPAAESGFQRLLRGRHDRLLDEILEDILPHDPALAGRRLAQIGGLTDEQARGLAILQEISDHLPSSRVWGDVFDLPPNDRGELLGLIARVRPSLEDTEGLAATVGRVLSGPGTNVQGTFGHLWAVRTLQRRFPGATFRLEVQAGRREIDIVMRHQGRTIAVEVKTGLSASPPISPEQIQKDLIRHLDDRFDNLLYLYEPGQQGSLGDVRQAFRTALAQPGVQAELARKGIPPTSAETWLNNRLAGDLVGVFGYGE